MSLEEVKSYMKSRVGGSDVRWTQKGAPWQAAPGHQKPCLLSPVPKATEAEPRTKVTSEAD